MTAISGKHLSAELVLHRVEALDSNKLVAAVPRPEAKRPGRFCEPGELRRGDVLVDEVEEA